MINTIPHNKNFDQGGFLFINIFICLLSFLIAAAFLAFTTSKDIYLILSDFYQTQFLPNKNTFTVQTNSNVNFLYVYYIAILISFFLLIFALKAQCKLRAALQHHLKIQMMMIVSILLVSQTINHLNYFKTEIKKFYGKSIEQKVSYNVKNSYAFAQYCKGYIRGKHRCQALTDSDLRPQKNLFTYLAIRYYLYPIDIVTKGDGTDFDCMIIFLKDDPASVVPPSFAVKPPFDSKSLIAIKKTVVE